MLGFVKNLSFETLIKANYVENDGQGEKALTHELLLKLKFFCSSFDEVRILLY